ncbi:MAG TPA: glycosyltransferase family A protein [Thermoanaerobaculia bacterium]|nr:glycosyltransferase family A protein [Thermoanaerobaculia bacterium]
MELPAFTVIIPVRDREGSIGRAILSVLEQEYADLEVVVVDDGSSDGTSEVVKTVADSRVRLLRQQPQGVSAARNYGAAEARGRWLTFLDSDDEALPGWLASFAALLCLPDTGVACVGVEMLVGAGEPERISPSPLGPIYEDSSGLFLAGSFALRLELFTEVGGYDAALAYSENTELGLRLTTLCRVRGLEIRCDPQARIRYRPSVSTGDHAKRRTIARLESARLLLARYGERLGREPRVLASYWAIASVAAGRLGRFSEARRFAVRAVAVRPWNPRHWGRLALCLVPGLGRRVWARQSGIDP